MLRILYVCGEAFFQLRATLEVFTQHFVFRLDRSNHDFTGRLSFSLSLSDALLSLPQEEFREANIEATAAAI